MKTFNVKDLKKERDHLDFLINEFDKPEPSYELAIAAGIKKITNADSTTIYSGETYIQMEDGSLWSARANSPILVGPQIIFEKISSRTISTGSRDLDEQWLTDGKKAGVNDIVIINPDGTHYVMPKPELGILGPEVMKKTMIGSKIYNNGELMATVEEQTQEEIDRWKITTTTKLKRK